jgi:predicted transposase/invertase (TIGR01784 family)
MTLTYDIKKDVRYQQGREEGILEGKEKGKKEGKEEGEEKKQLEIAHNMKKAGMSVEQIAEFTGLTQARIKKL